MATRSYFTSESVSMGHPDKMCDQISDAILDALLAEDPKSRVACETMATTGMVIVAGEITTEAVVSYSKIVRNAVREIGYTSSEMGFDANTLYVMELYDHFGQKTVIRFSDFERDPGFTADTFRFTPPPGVDVVSE